MEFNEENLRKGINMGLGSQGIWTPELGEIMFKEIRNQALSQHNVSGSILPIGFKVYVCTDCGEINVKKDNREIRVGFCDECDHPLWNDYVD